MTGTDGGRIRRRLGLRRPWGVVLGVQVVLLLAPALDVPAGAATPQAVLPKIALVGMTPDVGSTLTAVPAAVTLTFDQNLSHGTLTVTGPSGDAASAAAAIQGTKLTVPLSSGLPEGAYTVTWLAKAVGYRRNTGSYTFKVDALSASTVPPVTSPPAGGPTAGGPPAATGLPRPTGSTGSPRPSPLRAGAGPKAGSHSTTPARSVLPVGAAKPGGTTAPTPNGAPPASVLALGPKLAAEPTAAKVDRVSSLVSGSRWVGAWLIGLAVLLQIGAGLWGLWRRHREAVVAARTANAAAPVPDEGEPDPGREDWQGMVSAAALTRPWTGELHVRREAGEAWPV